MIRDEQEQQPTFTDQFRYPPWYKGGEFIESTDSLDLSEADQIIEDAFGVISGHFGGYQRRDDQIEMAKKILRNMLGQKTFVLEAGTGIGKSFAYLVPAIACSYLSGERVVLTTETKNLQLQIFNKDLPVIADILDPGLTYELTLGSGNYFCRLRHDDVLHTGSFMDLITEQEMDTYKKWTESVIANKIKGHLYELYEPINSDFWSLVSRNPDGCPSNRCLYFSHCNYYRAKAAWSNSRILVANHHLFLYNLVNDKRTLPSYGYSVVDEAHGFSKTAQSILTYRFHAETIADQRKGFEKATRSSLAGEALQEWSTRWRHAEEGWRAFFSMWEVELSLSFEENGLKIISADKKGDLSGVQAVLEEISNLLDEMIKGSEESNLLNSLNAIRKTVIKGVHFIQMFRIFDFNRMVYWGEKKQGRFFLYTCGIELGNELAPMMVEPQLWTSATLGYNDGRVVDQKAYFRKFMEELVPPDDLPYIETATVPSPFDYENHSVLYIPKDLNAPEWNAPEGVKAAYEDELFQEIRSLIDLSGGGALVLFTSNYLMRQIGQRLADETSHQVISQLDHGADEALNLFKKSKDAVLLGANSFWQGVDVTGNTLRMLIITKLMFTPPDDPILKARSRILETRNKKPFFELSLPDAAMMLRQAFGRLIRSETDKGVAAILDNRILQKSYGRTLLGNLPRIPMITVRGELEKRVSELKLLD